MADISNKTLALLMVAAIVVSLGGLFVSLDRLSNLQSGVYLPGITGFQTSPQIGTANVSIQSNAALTIVDAIINFGACTPPSVGWINVSSNATGGGYCDGPLPDFIYLRNDGNQYLNVTVKTNVSAAVFLGNAPSNNTAFYYMTAQSLSANAGCVNNVDACPTGDCNTRADSTNYTLQVNWTNISAREFVEFKACHNLTFGGGVERNFTVYARIQIPDDLASSTDRRAALNFTGYVIT